LNRINSAFYLGMIFPENRFPLFGIVPREARAARAARRNGV